MTQSTGLNQQKKISSIEENTPSGVFNKAEMLTSRKRYKPTSKEYC